MRPFAYASPTSIDEALSLLMQDGASIRPLAGGTDLLTLIKADVAAPQQLVNLKRLPDLSDRIEDTANGLTLGARATLADVETSEVIRQRYSALAEAAAEAATPQLRNMATIGGNLLQRPRCWYYRNHLFRCWLKGGDECQARDGENHYHSLFGHDASPCVAVHPSDPAVALTALAAEVVVRSPQGERTLPIAGLFGFPDESRRTETTLGTDELIISIRIPAPADGTRSTYLKAMDRKEWSFAIVAVAAVLRVDNGEIAHARLALGGVANVPWRAEAAERLLIGQRASDALIARAADAALEGAEPLQHNAYKIPLAKALIRRALASVAGS
jgi:xanthine dehydrogenase YagS FAD-binding subunit